MRRHSDEVNENICRNYRNSFRMKYKRDISSELDNDFILSVINEVGVLSTPAEEEEEILQELLDHIDAMQK